MLPRPMHGRIGGHMDLAEKRHRMSRFHYAEMELMEIVASWVETMRFIPLLAGMAMQIYDQARHVDTLAWALRNLKRMGRVVRAEAPSDEFVALCERIWRIQDPALRLVALDRVVRPHLIQAYLAYSESTDGLGDLFSIRVLAQCIADHRAHMEWADRMLLHLLDSPARRGEAADLQQQLERELAACGGVLSEGAEAIYLAYAGWPEAPDTASARYDLPPAAPAQWHTAGYTYRKTFQPIYRLPWDERLAYADSPADLPESAPTRSREGMLRYLHDLIQGETVTFDRNGWILVDFPELPWPMRLDIAQQAWEEGRHLEIVCQLIEGLGGQIGMYPLAPYFGYARREHHHPVAHLVIGNIINEGGAAAWTNEMLDFTAGWGNAWLRSGLEHLSADEVVHSHFGKKWGRALSAADPERYWHEGRCMADRMLDRMSDLNVQWGGAPIADAYRQRVMHEFQLLRPDTADEETALASPTE